MWLVPDRFADVIVEVHLDDDRIRIVSNEIIIGDWPWTEVDIETSDDGIHLFAEAEELVIRPDEFGFKAALPGALAQAQTPDSESRPRSRRGAHAAPTRMRWRWT